MAEGKKAFVVYTDWQKYIDDLNDAQIGKWTRWMFEYCNDKWKNKDSEIIYPKDRAVKMLCMITKDILKRDLKKYESKVESVSKAREKRKYNTDNDIETNIEINDEINDENNVDFKPVISNKLLVNSNKLLVNKEKEIEKEKTPQSRFSPPSLEEIKIYCDERRNKVDPERFYNFYASKGWMVGKNKMKDWKAAMRGTWEKEAGFKTDDSENPNGGFREL